MKTINSIKDIIDQLDNDPRFVLARDIDGEAVDIYIKYNFIKKTCPECNSKYELNKTFSRPELKKWLRHFFTKEFEHDFVIEVAQHSKTKVIIRKRLTQETYEYRDEHFKKYGIDVLKEMGIE